MLGFFVLVVLVQVTTILVSLLTKQPAWRIIAYVLAVFGLSLGFGGFAGAGSAILGSIVGIIVGFLIGMKFRPA